MVILHVNLETVADFSPLALAVVLVLSRLPVGTTYLHEAVSSNLSRISLYSHGLPVGTALPIRAVVMSNRSLALARAGIKAIFGTRVI